MKHVKARVDAFSNFKQSSTISLDNWYNDISSLMKALPESEKKKIIDFRKSTKIPAPSKSSPFILGEFENNYVHPDLVELKLGTHRNIFFLNLTCSKLAYFKVY